MSSADEHPMLIDADGHTHPAPDFLTAEELGRYLRLSETGDALEKRLAALRQRLSLPHFRRGARSNTGFIYPSKLVRDWALSQVRNGCDMSVVL